MTQARNRQPISRRTSAAKLHDHNAFRDAINTIRCPSPKDNNAPPGQKAVHCIKLGYQGHNRTLIPIRAESCFFAPHPCPRPLAAGGPRPFYTRIAEKRNSVFLCVQKPGPCRIRFGMDRVLIDILYSHFADLTACYLCAQISKYSSRNSSSFFMTFISFPLLVWRHLVLFAGADLEVFLEEHLQLLHRSHLLQVRLFLSVCTIAPKLEIVKYYDYYADYIFFV